MLSSDVMVHPDPHLVGVYGLLAADVGVGGELVYDNLVLGLNKVPLYEKQDRGRRHLREALVHAAECLVELPADALYLHLHHLLGVGVAPAPALLRPRHARQLVRHPPARDHVAVVADVAQRAGADHGRLHVGQVHRDSVQYLK